MVATDDQRNFAASTINYFNIDLKGGANDKLKALVKATQKTVAGDIAAAIAGATTITQANMDQAVKDAQAAFAKLNGDFTALGISFAVAKSAVDNLASKITETTTAAGKITDTTQKTAVTTPLGEAQAQVKNAIDALAKIDLAAMAKLTGNDLAQAINDGKTAIGDAITALNDSTNGAKAKLVAATTAAANITDATEKTAVTTPLGEATTLATTAGDAIGDSNKGLVKDAATAGNDFDDYKKKQGAADGMVVGDDPVMTAAKAYITACVSKITDFTKIQGTDVVACNTELLKNYGLINAILKNLPNKADAFLKSSGTSFNDYAANLNDSGNEAKLKAANAYFKIAVTVTGSEPFATGDAIPEPKSYTNHATHVGQSLDQLNAMSYALLQGTNCGSANKADLSVCYGVHATDLIAIYNPKAIDDMNIDVSAKYPFEDAFKGNTDLPVIE